MASASKGEKSISWGITRNRLSRAATLSTSLSMLRRTPGYCTLMARCSPSRVTASWTCPMEAAARGVKENRLKPRSQPLPQARLRTSATWPRGMVWASLRSRSRTRLNSGGRNSPASMDMSWPTFIAAPRISESRSARRRALAGVSSRSPIDGRRPWASWRAPSPKAPPAMPPASRPRCISRSRRDSGIRRSMGMVGAPALRGVPTPIGGNLGAGRRDNTPTKFAPSAETVAMAGFPWYSIPPGMSPAARKDLLNALLAGRGAPRRGWSGRCGG